MIRKKHNIHNEIEIETKLDVPLYHNDKFIIDQAKKVLEKEGWEIMDEREDEKDILYYDTKEFKLHHQGATLRRVTPFDHKKFPGSVRYDFKQGRGELRLEAKAWSSEVLPEDEILSLLCLENRLDRITPIVQVHITPKFLDIEKYSNGKTQVSAELKLDTCFYKERALFRELEVELKTGDPKEIYELTNEISKYFGFSPINQQKYSRVLEVLELGGENERKIN